MKSTLAFIDTVVMMLIQFEKTTLNPHPIPLKKKTNNPKIKVTPPLLTTAQYPPTIFVYT
jgi:hypothetical protein